MCPVCEDSLFLCAFGRALTAGSTEKSRAAFKQREKHTEAIRGANSPKLERDGYLTMQTRILTKRYIGLAGGYKLPNKSKVGKK